VGAGVDAGADRRCGGHRRCCSYGGPRRRGLRRVGGLGLRGVGVFGVDVDGDCHHGRGGDGQPCHTGGPVETLYAAVGSGCECRELGRSWLPARAGQFRQGCSAGFRGWARGCRVSVAASWLVVHTLCTLRYATYATDSPRPVCQDRPPVHRRLWWASPPQSVMPRRGAWSPPRKPERSTLGGDVLRTRIRRVL